MTTVNKLFKFNTDTEGWSSNPSEDRVDMLWGHGRRKPDARTGPILADAFGHLRTTARNDSVGGSHFWEWTGTFIDLGVPSDMSIIGITASYMYRWLMRPRGHAGSSNNMELFAGDAKSGPLELLDVSNSLIGIFSFAEDCPDRNSGDNWKAYPSGTPPEYPVSAEPISWVKPTGDITGLSIASGDTIKLRLYSTMPDVPFTADTRTDAKFIRLKQDQINLDIDYTTGGPPPILSPHMGFFGIM